MVDLLPSSYEGPQRNGYKLIISGRLHKDLVVDKKHSPCLVQGSLVIPKGRTLALMPGSELRILPDADNSKAKSRAQLWCQGRFLADGLEGGAVRISGPDTGSAEIHFSSSSHSELRGVRLSGISITQMSSNVHWIGCVFDKSPYYAVASGAASFIHCTLRECGGILATYDKGKWALLVRRTSFEECEDGIVLGNDPGRKALDVKENSFTGTRGAHLRAWPKNGSATGTWREFLIGENWYGTTIPEQIDLKIMDGRTNRAIRARINTRAPALQAYRDCGAEASLSRITRTYHATTAARKEIVALCSPTKKTQDKGKRTTRRKTPGKKSSVKGT